MHYKAGILVNLIFMHNLPPSCQACELSRILASLQMEIYWMNCSHNGLEFYLKLRLKLLFQNREWTMLLQKEFRPIVCPVVAAWNYSTRILHLLQWCAALHNGAKKIWSIKGGTVKLGNKERFDKEQIGIREPFPVTNLPFTSYE